MEFLRWLGRALYRLLVDGGGEPLDQDTYA